MSRQGTIKRYTLIIDKTSRNLYPTLREIQLYLTEHGFNISNRTLQRNFEQIRDEFGVEITYNKERKGYYIDKEKSVSFESFIRFLEIANTAELLNESIKDSKRTLEYISFDDGGSLEGIHNLKHLLQAIKTNKVITFTHYNFHKDSYSEKNIYPYLLKEYMNRWYIIGLNDVNNETFITYGIDRISNLNVTDEIFKKNDDLHPSSLFANIIGLDYSESNMEEVILKYTPNQAKYIKTLPLHHSQEVLKEDENEVIIKIKVKPNFELIQKILIHGSKVEVIKPISLRNTIKETLQQTLNNYI